MTIKEITMYQVICDNCGHNAQADTEYFAWAEQDQAREDACDGSEFTQIGDQDFCSECVHFCEASDDEVRQPGRRADCKLCQQADVEAGLAP